MRAGSFSLFWRHGWTNEHKLQSKEFTLLWPHWLTKVTFKMATVCVIKIIDFFALTVPVPCLYGNVRCKQKHWGSRSIWIIMLHRHCKNLRALRATEGQTYFIPFLQEGCSVSGQGTTGGQEYPAEWFIHGRYSVAGCQRSMRFNTKLDLNAPRCVMHTRQSEVKWDFDCFWLVYWCRKNVQLRPCWIPLAPGNLSFKS